MERSKQFGLSMVELIIGVAILAVIATFAIPGYQQMTENSKIRTATESVLAGLQIARAEAVSRNRTVQLEMGAGNNAAWTVCECPDPNNPVACVAASTIRSASQNDGGTGDITVTPSVVGAVYYIFNGFGGLESPAVVAPARVSLAIDNPNLDAADSRDLQIEVGVGGAIKSCDPNLLAPDLRAC